MGGEQGRGMGVFKGSLDDRITTLEGRMGAVESGMLVVARNATQAAQDAATAAANTKELLAIANATRTVAGVIRKHGPKAISFGAGVMTILGIGNPELWQYVRHFFGG